jgi:hypothetical protein
MNVPVVCPEDHFVAGDNAGGGAVAIAVDVGQVACEFGIFQRFFFVLFILIVLGLILRTVLGVAIPAHIFIAFYGVLCAIELPLLLRLHICCHITVIETFSESVPWSIPTTRNSRFVKVGCRVMSSFPNQPFTGELAKYNFKLPHVHLYLHATPSDHVRVSLIDVDRVRERRETQPHHLHHSYSPCTPPTLLPSTA